MKEETLLLPIYNMGLETEKVYDKFNVTEVSCRRFKSSDLIIFRAEP